MLGIKQFPIDIKSFFKLPNIPDMARRSITSMFPDFRRQSLDQLRLTRKIMLFSLFLGSLLLVSLDDGLVIQILLQSANWGT